MKLGKGGKNRRRGKNENEAEKRELVFKEDGQGLLILMLTFDQIFNSFYFHRIRPSNQNARQW